MHLSMGMNGKIKIGMDKKIWVEAWLKTACSAQHRSSFDALIGNAEICMVRHIFNKPAANHQNNYGLKTTN